jgi:hypothetical protein
MQKAALIQETLHVNGRRICWLIAQLLRDYLQGRIPCHPHGCRVVLFRVAVQGAFAAIVLVRA